MKKLKKRLGTILVLLLMFTLIPINTTTKTVHAATAAAAAAATSIKVGDYVQFGKYYGQPIAWRVINIDSDGSPMLWSEKILCLKPFDEPENGKYVDGASASDGYGFRQLGGSNKWENSNIREWLNSSDAKVKYSTSPPTKEAIWQGINAYADETGFLSNFSSSERNMIRPTTHKTILDKMDKDDRDGGTQPPSSNFDIRNLSNSYDNVYYKTVTDQVYILDIIQLHNYVYNRGWELRKMPTKEAVTESDYSEDGLNPDKYWYYWINNPSTASSSSVCCLKNNEVLISYGHADSGGNGIIPALNIKSDVSPISGDGSQENPYIFAKAEAAGNISVSVNGKNIKLTQPVIKENDLILVPIRDILEEMGYKVDWDAKAKRVTVGAAGRTVEFYVNSKMAIANKELDLSSLGIKLGADVNKMISDVFNSVRIINDRLMVPIEFIKYNIIDLQSSFDRNTNTLNITYDKSLINDLFRTQVVDNILNNNLLGKEQMYETFTNNYIIDKNGVVKWEIKAADAASELSFSAFSKNLGDPVYSQVGTIMLDIAGREENRVYKDVVSKYKNVNKIVSTLQKEGEKAGVFNTLLDSKCDKNILKLIFENTKTAKGNKDLSYLIDLLRSGKDKRKVFDINILKRFSTPQIQAAIKTLADASKDESTFLNLMKKGFLTGNNLKLNILAKLPSQTAKLLNSKALRYGILTYDSVRAAMFLGDINEGTIIRLKRLSSDVTDPKIKAEIDKIIQKTQDDFITNGVKAFSSGVFDMYTTTIIKNAYNKVLAKGAEAVAKKVLESAAADSVKIFTDKAAQNILRGSNVLGTAIIGLSLGSAGANLLMSSTDIFVLDIKMAAAVRLKNELKSSVVDRINSYKKLPSKAKRDVLIDSLENYFSVEALGTKYFNSLCNVNKEAVLQRVFRNDTDNKNLDFTIQVGIQQTDALESLLSLIVSFKDIELSTADTKNEFSSKNILDPELKTFIPSYVKNYQFAYLNIKGDSTKEALISWNNGAYEAYEKYGSCSKVLIFEQVNDQWELIRQYQDKNIKINDNGTGVNFSLDFLNNVYLGYIKVNGYDAPVFLTYGEFYSYHTQSIDILYNSNNEIKHSGSMLSYMIKVNDGGKLPQNIISEKKLILVDTAKSTIKINETDFIETLVWSGTKFKGSVAKQSTFAKSKLVLTHKDGMTEDVYDNKALKKKVFKVKLGDIVEFKEDAQKYKWGYDLMGGGNGDTGGYKWIGHNHLQTTKKGTFTIWERNYGLYFIVLVE